MTPRKHELGQFRLKIEIYFAKSETWLQCPEKQILDTFKSLVTCLR